MYLKKWKANDNVYGLQDSVNRLFDNFFGRDEEGRADLTTSWYPLTNIYENKDMYFLKMDLPGLETKDIHIEFKEQSIVISGERKEDIKVDSDTCHRAEIPYGKFTRSFLLPNSVNQEKIDAKLKNGILEVSIPKAETAKPKSIKINTK